MSEPQLHEALQRGLERMRIEVTDDQCEALADYVSLLVKWNRVINLTAVRDPQQMVSRHILDSLSVHEHVDGDSLIDVGAGAGLPGIPLAILKPHMNVTLIDKVAKAYPIQSTQDIPGFFDRTKNTVGGKTMTLNQLEKEYLLKQYGDCLLYTSPSPRD